MDKYSLILKKINEIDEVIKYLRSRLYSPKSQTITGLPSGGNIAVDLIESYIERIEELEEKKATLIKELKSQQNNQKNN